MLPCGGFGRCLPAAVGDDSSLCSRRGARPAIRSRGMGHPSPYDRGDLAGVFSFFSRRRGRRLPHHALQDVRRGGRTLLDKFMAWGRQTSSRSSSFEIPARGSATRVIPWDGRGDGRGSKSCAALGVASTIRHARAGRTGWTPDGAWFKPATPSSRFHPAATSRSRDRFRKGHVFVLIKPAAKVDLVGFEALEPR